MTALNESAVELRTALHEFVARRVPLQDAEDVLQDVFVRLQRGLGDVRDDQRLAGWMYQVARHAIADHYRKPGHRREQAVADLSDVPVVVESADASEPPAGLVHATISFMQRLSAEDREALELTDLQGLTQAEAARRLGLSTPGMKSRVQRARARLRDLLDGCCAIEVDARGGIVDCEPRQPPADMPDCCSGSRS